MSELGTWIQVLVYAMMIGAIFNKLDDIYAELKKKPNKREYDLWSAFLFFRKQTTWQILISM